MARYLVGIDLGTTHTAVAYAELAGQAGAAPIQLFEIEQLVAPGEVAALPLLPSLRYHPMAEEIADGDLQLPWGRAADVGSALERDLPRGVTGAWARELGSRVPGRLVASAKSWLSHTAVERMAPILPWGAPPEVAKISPVQASAGYLAHVRSAWNTRFPDDALEVQEVVLTVPASFDEGARSLTLEAARRAGLAQVRLLEEPQAACYDWLDRHSSELAEALADRRLLLVCDVGGGTTDLTLIKIDHAGEGPRLTRVGVGDHLMLGGDNMDLALAHVAEGHLVESGTRLSSADLSLLMQQCRDAKERLLAPGAPPSASVTLLGSGARLIGAARTTELERDQVQSMVIDGFFPRVAARERPQRLRGGIVEFGLPYVADPAVSRHLAAFLAQHAQAAREALGGAAPSDDALPVPDAVLLNGGVFRSAALAERLLQVLSDWRGQAVRQLSNPEPHLAVARGAVAYGLTRYGRGARIGGGSARSYFVLVETEQEGQQQGVCILPRGTEEGHAIELADRTFSLRLGQPVQFHLASSTGDAPFTPGELTEIDVERFRMLPPLATLLGQKDQYEGASSRQQLPVHLSTTLTEVGTLQISCVGVEPPAARWRLEFQLRGQSQAATAALPDVALHPRFGEAAGHIARLYGDRAQKVSPKEVKALRVNLEKALGKRDTWDTPLLRELFGTFWEQQRRRRRSADHERLWLNLVGYCLRPGFGYPLDDWRVKQLWAIYGDGVQFGNEAQVWVAWWNLWRRISGGLDVAAQTKLLADITSHLRPQSGRRRRGGVPAAPSKQANDDIVRLAGALERLPAERKVEVGDWLLQRLRKPGESPHTWWAVGRIGARVPFYGSAHNVIDREIALRWLRELLKINWRAVKPAAFAATLLARVSGDRERDLDETVRAQVVERLRSAKSPTSWVQMVQELTELDASSEQLAFGESLPPGLRLLH